MQDVKPHSEPTSSNPQPTYSPHSSVSVRPKSVSLRLTDFGQRNLSVYDRNQSTTPSVAYSAYPATSGQSTTPIIKGTTNNRPRIIYQQPRSPGASRQSAPQVINGTINNRPQIYQQPTPPGASGQSTPQVIKGTPTGAGNTVIINQQPTPPPSYAGHVVMACFVFWCCGAICGFIAFILAMCASSYASEVKPETAAMYGKASKVFIVIGVVVGIFMVIIVIVLYFSAGLSTESSSRSSSYY